MSARFLAPQNVSVNGKKAAEYRYSDSLETFLIESIWLYALHTGGAQPT
jgi:hypothetical protein